MYTERVINAMKIIAVKDETYGKAGKKNRLAGIRTQTSTIPVSVENVI